MPKTVGKQPKTTHNASGHHHDFVGHKLLKSFGPERPRQQDTRESFGSVTMANISLVNVRLSVGRGGEGWSFLKCNISKTEFDANFGLINYLPSDSHAECILHYGSSAGFANSNFSIAFFRILILIIIGVFQGSRCFRTPHKLPRLMSVFAK